jgi:hypothetical protein
VEEKQTMDQEIVDLREAAKLLNVFYNDYVFKE